jgi:hypothetical protein
MSHIAPTHLLLTICVVALAFSAGCGTSRSEPQETGDQFFENFKDRVEEAEAEGWDPYWLGMEFHAGDLVFRGPSVDDFGSEVDGGGVNFHYTARLPDEGGGVGLTIILYSPSAWERARATQGGSAPGTERTFIDFLGEEAEVLLTPAGTRPVGQAALRVQLGDTMLVAVAGSGGSPSPGAPDLNPLVDKETFISVMQQLRPYPE